MKKIAMFFLLLSVFFFVSSITVFADPLGIVYVDGESYSGSNTTLVITKDITSLTATGADSSNLYNFELTTAMNPLTIGTLGGSNSVITIKGDVSVTNDVSASGFYKIILKSGSEFEAKNLENVYLQLEASADDVTIKVGDIINIGGTDGNKVSVAKTREQAFIIPFSKSNINVTMGDFIYKGFKDCKPVFTINSAESGSERKFKIGDIFIEGNKAYIIPEEEPNLGIDGDVAGVWLHGINDISIDDIVIKANETVAATCLYIENSTVEINSASVIGNTSTGKLYGSYRFGVMLFGSTKATIGELYVVGNTGNASVVGLFLNNSATLNSNIIEMHGNDFEMGEKKTPYTGYIYLVTDETTINIGEIPNDVTPPKGNINIYPEGLLKVSGLIVTRTNFSGYVNNGGTLHIVENTLIAGNYTQDEDGLLKVSLLDDRLADLVVLGNIVAGSVEVVAALDNEGKPTINSNIVDKELPFLYLNDPTNSLTGLANDDIVSHNLGSRYNLTIVLDDSSSPTIASILVSLNQSSNPNDFDLSLPYNAEQTLKQISDMYPVNDDIVSGTPINDIVLEMISSYDEVTEAGDKEVLRLLNSLSGVIHTATFNMSLSGVEEIAMSSRQTEVSIIPIYQFKKAFTDHNASEFYTDFRGGIIDANLKRGTFNAGVTLSAGITELTQKLEGSNGSDIDTAKGYDIQAGLSLGFMRSKIYFDIYAGYGITHTDVWRNIRAAEEYTLNSTYNINKFLASAKISYNNGSGQGLTLMLGLTYDLRWRDDVLESGEETLALQILDRAYNKFILSIGGTYKVKTDIVDLSFTAMYKHNFSYEYFDIDVKFINADGLYNIRGIDMGRSTVVTSVTLEKDFNESVKAIADIDLELGMKTILLTTKLGMTYKF